MLVCFLKFFIKIKRKEKKIHAIPTDTTTLACILISSKFLEAPTQQLKISSLLARSGICSAKGINKKQKNYSSPKIFMN